MKNIQSFALCIVLLTMVLACGNRTQVSTGGEPANVVASSVIRRVNVNQAKDFGGLSVTIGEIALETGKITVGVTLNNKSKNTLMLYPDQGSLVIGKSQLKANMFMTNGDLSGEIHTGVEKQGSLAFLDESKTVDPATVKQISLRLGNIASKDFMTMKEIEWTVDLP